MDLKSLKLKLIKRISESQDIELLQTILQLVDQLDAAEQLKNQELNELLKDKQAPWQKKDLDDLQSSIDEIFG